MFTHYKTRFLHIFILIALLLTLLYFPRNAYAALIISDINPRTISNLSDNTITITGNDFVMGTVVSIDGYGTLSTSYFSNTTLMAIVPPGVPVGTYDITVTNPDSSSATLPNSLVIVTE